jgi:CrcB protein
MRYVLGTAIMSRTGGRFPFGTVVINITGSFLIGLLMTLLTERLSPHPNWRLLLVVGFLGGYTTFSSFEWETFGLMRDGARWLGLLNVIGSVVIGYLAVWLGVAAAGKR